VSDNSQRSPLAVFTRVVSYRSSRPKNPASGFAIGADDYISKPVIASELANRILNRLQRNRVLTIGNSFKL
jgi:DNA-binding response OmpR family regulator